MSYLVDNWSFDPFVIGVAVIVVLHELGLANLRRRSVPARTRRRRLNSLFFYAGLGVLLLAVTSPDRLLGRRLLLRAHGRAHPDRLLRTDPHRRRRPWLPLLHGLPVRFRRWLMRAVAARARRRTRCGRWAGSSSTRGRPSSRSTP